MKIQSRSTVYSILIALSLLLGSCGMPSPRNGQTSPSPIGDTPDPLNAVLNQLQGKVEARTTTQSEFAAAGEGMSLQTGGQVRTGDDGRARLNLSTGSFVRVGPSSLLTLSGNEQQAAGLLTKIELEAGKVWAILSGGQISVETPSGVASVRGSYMSAEVRPAGGTRITCLEGACTIEAGAITLALVAGQGATVLNAGGPPQQDQMTPQEIQEWLAVNPEAEVILPAVTATQQALPGAPQPSGTPVSLGPDEGDFPAGFNPLTGQPAADPGLLDLPAILLSVSHFPASARPQSGLSFAPMVFEIYITEGATRFLAVFYGDFPAQQSSLDGGCAVRADPFKKSGAILGNRVWFDENANGVQDAGEHGVGGVCVRLHGPDGSLSQETTTDSNGFFGFNLQPGAPYQLEFVLPAGTEFTQPNVGDEDHDSDASPADGMSAPIPVEGDALEWDAGLVAAPESATPAAGGPQVIPPQVGPVRSGRLIYSYIGEFFQNSCLIIASAAQEVLERLPKCSMAFGNDSGAGSMLNISRLEDIAQENARKSGQFNYASNRFADQAPTGGLPAAQVDVFYSFLNQSGWVYDPLEGAWLRYVDAADQDNPGVLHADTDRLTGRQVYVENLIVLFADHEVISSSNLDIHLNQGETGDAYLFRDGQRFKIKWSTRAGEYEQATGLRRPIAFVDEGGNPVLLKPGHTWVLVVTPFSTVEETSPGDWRVRFYAPEGAK